MGRLMTVATCQLNQWSLDFEGNTQRIIESISKAKVAGAVLRVGPELEISGYGCQDHFLEGDTYLHSFQCLATILQDDACHGMLIDVGMPIRHRNVRFNCRVIFTSSAETGPRILLIRPKMWLADDGNFRESRWFSPWQKERQTEPYYLEQVIRDITGQDTVPFGDGVISTRDTCVGVETCEELFTPNSPHIAMGLNGVEVFTNSSGSHHELRKLNTRVSLMVEATRQNGGLYLYSNQQGCDGDRLYYDGCSMIILNGRVLAQGSQFSLNDVEVVSATIDIEEVRSFRASSSRGLQAVQSPAYPRFEVDLFLSNQASEVDYTIGPTAEKEIRYHMPEEELALGPPSYLWDYLRRSGAAGYFVPLSGGIDSCSTAVMVFSMCRLVFAACQAGNDQVLKDCRRVCARSDSSWIPTSPQEVCNAIFHTCYMGSKNSSMETRARARDLAKEIGAYHTDLNIDSVIDAIVSLFSFITGFGPKFKAHGGSNSENLALQNIQARLRMLLAYLFAQLLPTVRKRPGGGGLLVLGSANVDESLRGYLTKYDCSSADINPIGAISKVDLKRFISYATTAFDLPILDNFLNATPTAELEPISETYVQSDEADMGMTYEELSVFGRLRKQSLLGPWGMYTRLLHVWGKPESLGGRGLNPRAIYEKVRGFFYYYSINRHKMTVLTPSYHAESYSPDDNRFDLRPFLYPKFNWIYRKMETNVEELERVGRKTVKAD